MKARWFLEATGSAVVLLFPVLAPVVSPGYRFVYHHQTPLTHLMNGLLLDFAGLTVAGLLVMVLLPHLSSVPRRLASGCLKLGMEGPLRASRSFSYGFDRRDVAPMGFPAGDRLTAGAVGAGVA